MLKFEIAHKIESGTFEVWNHKYEDGKYQVGESERMGEFGTEEDAIVELAENGVTDYSKTTQMR